MLFDLQAAFHLRNNIHCISISKILQMAILFENFCTCRISKYFILFLLEASAPIPATVCALFRMYSPRTSNYNTPRSRLLFCIKEQVCRKAIRTTCILLPIFEYFPFWRYKLWIKQSVYFMLWKNFCLILNDGRIFIIKN